jgi:hypothetical protein
MKYNNMNVLWSNKFVYSFVLEMHNLVGANTSPCADIGDLDEGEIPLDFLKS